MVTLGQVQNGVARYIDAEILPMMDGWKRWVFGGLGGVAIARADTVYKALAGNPMLQALGVIGADGGIDVDILYQEFRRQAQKSGPVSIDIPGIGSLKLGEADIEKLYKYITEA